jgi:hypothetical protein
MHNNYNKMVGYKNMLDRCQSVLKGVDLGNKDSGIGGPNEIGEDEEDSFIRKKTTTSFSPLVGTVKKEDE